MRRHEFWRERATGEVWAVELVDGVVTGSAGPLYYDQVDERLLDAFTYTAGRAEWLEAHRDEFDLYDRIAAAHAPAGGR